MKKLAYTLLSAVLFSAATITASAQDSSTQTRQVSDFSSIDSGGPFNVHIKMDGTESVKIEADANIINDIETVVESGTLKIKFKDREYRRYNNIHKTEIYVSARSLNGLINSGSGHMNVDGIITTSGEFKAILSGSGSINTSVKSGNLHAVISGSGSISINGNTGYADFVISGSGQIEGKDLKTESIKAVVTGSGNIYVAAEKSVSAHITGSGSVNYSGSASVVDSRSVGSGRVNHVD
jgi:hypothetical protein